ncbi:MAG: hypothetical protein H0T78_06950 [Longispora sp.]|nr:hypothetical protein [Longispora sp. (in: high G+C Gram-positive bacteria)]
MTVPESTGSSFVDPVSSVDPASSSVDPASSFDPASSTDPVLNPIVEPKPWMRGVYHGAVIVCAIWLALLTSTAEAFFTPFRLFGVLIPISVLAAVVITPILAIGTFRLTGRRALSLLPSAAWAFAALFWAQSSSEGDVVLAGDSWVSLLYLLAGSGAAAFGAYRVILAPLNRRAPKLEQATDLAI